MNLFQSIVQGLKEAIEHSQGSELAVVETRHAVLNDGAEKKTITTKTSNSAVRKIA